MAPEDQPDVPASRIRASPQRTPRWVKYLLGILGGFLVLATVVVLLIAFFPSDQEACIAPVAEGDGGLCCQAVHQHAARARILAAGFGWVFTITGYLAGLLGGLLGPAWAERAAREVPATQPVPVWPRVAGTFIAATGVSLGSVGMMLVARGQEAGIAAAGALSATSTVATRRALRDPTIGDRTDDQLLHDHCSATMARWVLLEGMSPTGVLSQGLPTAPPNAEAAQPSLLTRMLQRHAAASNSESPPASVEEVQITPAPP